MSNSRERAFFLDSVAAASAPSRRLVSEKMNILQEEAESRSFLSMLGAVSRKFLGELAGQLYLDAHIQRAVNGDK